MKSKIEDLEKEQLMLSLERTVLSKERTVLAEITVTLGFLALGFLVIRLFQDTPNKDLVFIGFALIIFSAITTLLEIYRFKKYATELKKIEKKSNNGLSEYCRED